MTYEKLIISLNYYYTKRAIVFELISIVITTIYGTKGDLTLEIPILLEIKQ